MFVVRSEEKFSLNDLLKFEEKRIYALARTHKTQNKKNLPVCKGTRAYNY